MADFIEKRIRLSDPVATTGDRVYVICSQNGLFPDPWHGHVPHEMWGVWDHPIKLLDGFWFALRSPASGVTRWLMEADACRVGLGYTEFDYLAEPLQITRRDFVPDGVEGLVVTITVQAPAYFTDPLELVVLVRSDLRPAWLGEQVGMHDGPDRVEAVLEHHAVKFQDEQNEWFALVGGDQPASEISLNDVASFPHTAGQGVSAQLIFPLNMQPTGTTALTLFIAGSAQSEAAAFTTFEQLRTEHNRLFATKHTHYQQIAQTSQLLSPDPILNEAFQWVKLNCQMLARATPDAGLCVGAGLPTYPWWFGIDTEYAVLPMLQAGLFDLTKASLRLLKASVKPQTRLNQAG